MSPTAPEPPEWSPYRADPTSSADTFLVLVNGREVRVTQQLWLDRGRLTDFVFLVQVASPLGNWIEIFRIDCAHHCVHFHAFGQSDRKTLREIHTQQDLIAGCNVAEDLIWKVEEHVRRWQRHGAS